MATPLPGAVPGNGSAALLVRGVTKSFGTVRALENVSLEVGTGEIVGLLGPNGAGKSTAMKLILGLLRPDAGAISLFGSDVHADPVRAKQLCGYVPENPALYEFLTAAEYLDFIADMYGMPREGRQSRIEQFLTALELTGHQDSMLSGYSMGMRQKVALTSALLHRPRLLILDEPLNGLDPRSARIVKDLLRTLATRDRVAVLFSTHVLEIAQAICDRVVILNQGHVLASGSLEALRQRSGSAGTGLEELFLTLTGTEDIHGVVDALTR